MAMMRDDELMGAGPRRRALLNQMGSTAGVQAPGLQAPTGGPPKLASVMDAASPPAGGLGQFGGALEGFDRGKLDDPSHQTPKYLIGRALSGFDPRQGVTPEVLAALNQLGIGQFSGSGDKVSIANGDPRFEGVSSLDLVRGFKDPNSGGGWQYGVDGPASSGPQGAPGMGMGAPGLGIGNLLTGDPTARIQQALGAFTQRSPNIEALLAQLAGQ